jgi:hypothetical protein
MTLCAIVQKYIEKLFDCLFSKKYNESLLQLEHPHSDNMEHYMIYKEKTQL